MAHYLALVIATGVIALLAAWLWKRTREFGFLLGIALMYYWSLYGAWAILSDAYSGGLYKELFWVELDDAYLRSLVLYGAFVVLVELVLVVLLRRAGPINKDRTASVRLEHWVVQAVAGSSGLVSYLLIRGLLVAAEENWLSAYAMAGSQHVGFYTIHQVLARAALFAAVLGFGVWCSGEKARLVVGGSGLGSGLGYLTILGGMSWMELVLGNRNELLVAGLAGWLFYLADAERPRIVFVAAIGSIGLVFLGLIDSVRGLPVTELGAAVRGAITSDFVKWVEVLWSSNEAFAAHLSMYGVLAYDVAPRPGFSLLSVAASVVPRFLWPDRPPDIYVYYVESIGVNAGRGYSIHHATGWYLNFGTWGVVIGAVVFGWVWGKCYLIQLKNPYKAGRSGIWLWYAVFAAIAPSVFVAYIPPLVRAGMEAYKGLVFEALLIPTFILTIASWRWRAP